MKHVLVIEDDRDLSQLFSTVLSLAGFKVDVAFTGTEGVMCLEQSMPDVVLLDMHLPGVSGREIYQMLDARQQAYRVLVCSADVQLVEEYKSQGVNAITKPIENIQDLMAVIARITEQSVVA